LEFNFFGKVVFKKFNLNFCPPVTGVFFFKQRQTGATRGGGVGGFKPSPPPEIPKALQNPAKLNPFVKTVKNC